jgi:anthranilate synthase
MCTDVDRNDKSLVCAPGTVRITAHRDVEMTSRVMHTVEHVTGELRDGFTGLDAFISHMWAVTVTGAPKLAAIDFIEAHENEPRRWYAGAFGRFVFNGDLDTGITIRTIHLHGGTASVRAGSTLLAKSDAEAERDECALKAAALLNVLDGVDGPGLPPRRPPTGRLRQARHVLVIDHEDSFVHTLADYIRQEGCRVTTIRAVRGRGVSHEQLSAIRPDVVCLSPGPGSPSEFRISESLAYAERHRLPVFGVCLGAQAIAEYFGGTLSAQHKPTHGIQSVVRRSAQSTVLRGLPERFLVGRYHSLRIIEATLPADLPATAWSEDGTVMCVEHNHLPFVGVQFHPESIMTAAGGIGHEIIRSILTLPTKREQEPSTI